MTEDATLVMATEAGQYRQIARCLCSEVSEVCAALGLRVIGGEAWTGDPAGAVLIVTEAD